MANRSKRNNRRRRSIRFKSLRWPLFLLVFFALVALGLYLALQTSLISSVLGIALANPTPAGSPPTPTRATTQAAQTPRLATPTRSTPVRVEQNWKDYSSPTFGYALKYPPNMFYREGKSNQDLLQSVSFYLEQDANLPLYQAPEIAVSIYSNPQSQTTAQWLAAHSKPVAGSTALFESVTDQQIITVGGLDALSFEDKSGGFSSHRILLARNNQVFSILVTDIGEGRLRETFWAVAGTMRWSAPRP